MTPVSGETSLAMIQSQPLRVSFALAFAIDVLGLGRKADARAADALLCGCAIVARMSGFRSAPAAAVRRPCLPF